MQIEARLQELGITIPEAPAPLANYVGAVVSGNHVHLSGAGPRGDAGYMHPGKLGQEVTTEQGAEAARICGINLLANLRAVIGDLDRVVRIVKVNGMVNCVPDFAELPQVLNGCSDFLVEVFGDKGKHARAVIGVAQMPLSFPVEIEMLVEVSD
jgi:enamine deaminase RidA (YjgF/YER057c/UK114 family)